MARHDRTFPWTGRTATARTRATRQPAWAALVATAVVALGLGLSGCGAPAASSSTPVSPAASPALLATMPNVIGMTAQNAADTVSPRAGISNVYVDGGVASAGLTVISQSPLPGASISSSTPVYLTVQQPTPNYGTTTATPTPEPTTTESAPNSSSDTDVDPDVPTPEVPHADTPSDSSHLCVKKDKNGRWRDSHGRFCSP